VPISKELLSQLGIFISGRIGTQWVCYVDRGIQYIHAYGPYGLKDPSPWTKPWQDKFAAGVAAGKSLSPDLKEYWGQIGVRKVEPLPWWNAFLSSWMLDLVNLSTMRHVRNLQVR
jgi:hypothetical protein